MELIRLILIKFMRKKAFRGCSGTEDIGTTLFIRKSSRLKIKLFSFCPLLLQKSFRCVARRIYRRERGNHKQKGKGNQKQKRKVKGNQKQ